MNYHETNQWTSSPSPSLLLLINKEQQQQMKIGERTGQILNCIQAALFSASPKFFLQKCCFRFVCISDNQSPSQFTIWTKYPGPSSSLRLPSTDSKESLIRWSMMDRGGGWGGMVRKRVPRIRGRRRWCRWSSLGRMLLPEFCVPIYLWFSVLPLPFSSRFALPSSSSLPFTIKPSLATRQSIHVHRDGCSIIQPTSFSFLLNWTPPPRRLVRSTLWSMIIITRAIHSNTSVLDRGKYWSWHVTRKLSMRCIDKSTTTDTNYWNEKPWAALGTQTVSHRMKN